MRRGPLFVVPFQTGQCDTIIVMNLLTGCLIQVTSPDGWSVAMPVKMFLQITRDLKDQMILTWMTGQLHGTGVLTGIQLNRQRGRGLTGDIANIGKRRESMTFFAPGFEAEVSGAAIH